MESMEKEFDINHCDLTVAENKEKFLKECLGEIYDAIKHEAHPKGIPDIELGVAMLYDRDLTIDNLKEDFEWREIGYTFKRQAYRRSYIRRPGSCQCRRGYAKVLTCLRPTCRL